MRGKESVWLVTVCGRFAHTLNFFSARNVHLG
jgi:hypothetical protein